MKLVIDTDILYSYFWKGSLTRSLIMGEDFELFAPELALKEIKNYKSNIIKKIKLNEREFETLLFDIAISVKFIPIEKYKNFLKKALKISPDPDDLDFFALALKLKFPLWSNDLLLKKQDKIRIPTTKEILGLIRKSE